MRAPFAPLRTHASQGNTRKFSPVPNPTMRCGPAENGLARSVALDKRTCCVALYPVSKTEVREFSRNFEDTERRCLSIQFSAVWFSMRWPCLWALTEHLRKRPG